MSKMFVQTEKERSKEKLDINEEAMAKPCRPCDWSFRSLKLACNVGQCLAFIAWLRPLNYPVRDRGMEQVLNEFCSKHTGSQLKLFLGISIWTISRICLGIEWSGADTFQIGSYGQKTADYEICTYRKPSEWRKWHAESQAIVIATYALAISN